MRAITQLSAIMLLGAFTCFTLSCSSTTCPEEETNDGPVVFATSFEADVDTVGWRQYGHIEVAEDAPPGGDSRSMLFGGGCIAPHASRTLEGIPANRRYKIRFWARLQFGSASVFLRTGVGTHQETRVEITSSEWAEYTSGGSVFVRSGEQLWIDLIAGGFDPGRAQIDLIEVIRISP